MKVITLDQVKQYTTLTDADDDDINLMLPVIDSKVRLITRNRWNYQIYLQLVTGQADAEVSGMVNYAGVSYGNSGINAPWVVDDIRDWLEVGAQLQGPGLTAGTYIEEVFYNGPDYQNKLIPVITLSQVATATGLNVVQMGIPLAYVPTIARGVQWLISSQLKPVQEVGVTSKSMGPVSISYSDKDAMIDGLSGMPLWFVKALPRYHGAY
jgi:hypothetical protein